MTAEPYVRARRVFWIVDNGSSHRGQVAADRLQTEWPNLVLVHLPFTPRGSARSRSSSRSSNAKGSSRRTTSPAWRPSSTASTPFERHYHTIARPYEWNFTRRDLADLSARVGDHEPRVRLVA
jgi:hypothetical protein